MFTIDDENDSLNSFNSIHVYKKKLFVNNYTLL
jgi:hypothetical protein